MSSIVRLLLILVFSFARCRTRKARLLTRSLRYAISLGGIMLSGRLPSLNSSARALLLVLSVFIWALAMLLVSYG